MHYRNTFEHWTHDRKVVGSSPGRSGGRIFFSRVNFLCWLLFLYPFPPPCVTAVADKRSRSFCQKCRWQVTPKHTVYTIQSCTMPRHFMQRHIRRVYAYLDVTCHLHFCQNDQDLLRAAAVTRGWNGYRNKSTESWPWRIKINYPAAPTGTQTRDLSITSPAL